MVAMSGRIIPAPLAMPVRVIVFPSIFSCVDKHLGRVSVVKIPQEASSQLPASSFANAAGTTAVILFTGRASPITPVEKGRTAWAEQPLASATA